MTASRDITAARALLAYFNRALALKLARHVLRESNATARKRLADAVLDQLPKVLGEQLFPIVDKFVRERGQAYVSGASFAKKVEEYIASSADRWCREALDTAARERATTAVRTHVESYMTREFLKTIPGRFQALVEQEVERRVKTAADAATGKTP